MALKQLLWDSYGKCIVATRKQMGLPNRHKRSAKHGKNGLQVLVRSSAVAVPELKVNQRQKETEHEKPSQLIGAGRFSAEDRPPPGLLVHPITARCCHVICGYDLYLQVESPVFLNS